jgi:hypothetical protein
MWPDHARKIAEKTAAGRRVLWGSDLVRRGAAKHGMCKSTCLHDGFSKYLEGDASWSVVGE